MSKFESTSNILCSKVEIFNISLKFKHAKGANFLLSHLTGNDQSVMTDNKFNFKMLFKGILD